MQKTLVIGSAGQIGVEIVRALVAKQGHENVFASDVHEHCPASLEGFNFFERFRQESFGRNRGAKSNYRCIFIGCFAFCNG